ncbi:F0F1 ATP synthase subunit epsilon [Luteococcus sp. Sow4_B9]|uniref:F0F1 ATP synthase subunit epsilon n=1 Tax=Luteococcus sp. Sow4_B9 TaxID=3438792 RepID=UPI003F9783B0
MADPINVEVVAADRRVWEGKASNVIVRTTEGDIGILAGHEPLMVALVPCAAEIVTVDGKREIIAVDGGFMAVVDNKVNLVAQKASLFDEISSDEAQREYDQLSVKHAAGEATDDEVHRLHLAEAQLKAAAKSNKKGH